MCDPLLLDHMEEGFELFKKHLEQGSTIYLCVDCDVDGYTSSAVLYNYYKDVLAEKYPNVKWEFNIPTGKEHGLETIMHLFENEKICDLIILPDSSSNDYTEHEALAALGYDILVLDHHHADKYSPHAVVINNQLSQDYPNKQASGVGVVYKFLQFCDACWDFDRADDYIDLVALGEISDMMEMQTPENRFICEYGLRNIKNELFRTIVKKQCYSLFGITEKEWTDDYYTNGEITQLGVAFYITPLINALIRVGTQSDKSKLFASFIDGTKEVQSTKRGAKPGDIETIATQVARNCSNAKTRQNTAKEKAIALLDIQISNNCLDENKILVLNADELDTPTTLTGLIAMGIAAKYKKPTIVGRTSPDGFLKGSGRGRDNTELEDFRQFLLDSGLMNFAEGHPNAFGEAIKISNIDKLITYANDKLKDFNFNEGFHEADFIIPANYSDITQLVTDIGQNKNLWGQGNKEPKIVIENLAIDKSTMKIMGASRDTVKFVFNGMTYIAFHAQSIIDQINNSSGSCTATCVGHAVLNKWMGRITPQIFIDEIEIKEMSIYDF